NELLGKKVEVLIPPRLRTHHQGHRTHFFAEPKSRPMGAGLDLWCLRKDGSEFPAEISLSPLGMGEEISATAAIRDITDRKRMEDQLRRAHDELEVRVEQRTADVRRLAGLHLQMVREEERTSIAREIHDDLGQYLTALRMDLSALERKVVAEASEKVATELLRRSRAMFQVLDQTLEVVRRISAQLRPTMIDELGIAAALEWQAGEFGRRSGIPCHYQSELKHMALDHEVSTAVFRIFQELLTNITRHAEATKVDVELKKTEETLILRVHDNGKGVTEAELERANSLGVIGMRERAHLVGGKIDFVGKPGKGTTVTLQVPYREVKEGEHS
ncbi:MAG: PAS domain-containing sensor histidine kinase, partial [Deltaproteobacteria bacterium]|nr:PAS domain-containing sensor histidine kinase [Deltaproteobacteria bacterium]